MVGERTHASELSAPRSCAQLHCEHTPATVLHKQDLCLTHFLAQSYEFLENFDRRAARMDRSENTCPLNPSGIHGFIEDCSIQALRLSLQCENLTNLERGRLLDILLWTGEISGRLRLQKTSVAPRSLRLAENAPSQSSTNP